MGKGARLAPRLPELTAPAYQAKSGSTHVSVLVEQDRVMSVRELRQKTEERGGRRGRDRVGYTTDFEREEDALMILALLGRTAWDFLLSSRAVENVTANPQWGWDSTSL